MRLVYRFDIGHDDRLRHLCEVSKNLYNQALYIVKKELRENGRWLGYSKLNKILQETHNLDGEINYRQLKAQVSQQCLRVLDKDISSYVKAVKDYSKNKDKYNGRPQFPRYKKDANQLIYTNQSCSVRDGHIILSKELKIRIPQYDKYKDGIRGFQQVRILPRLDSTFTVEIVYISEGTPNAELDYSQYSSIDLGVDNLAAMVLYGEEPVLFNGRQLKSKNQYFNKITSKLKSELQDGQRTSSRIRRLCVRRDRQVADIFHKVSRTVVRLLVGHRVGNLVIGYNKGWKDSINIGKRNNQTFVGIPYARLIGMIRYKCEMCGINVTVVDEGYTSKCDALALEPVERHESYLGRRVRRGLFQSSTGRLVNADVNGALNILRKVVGDSEFVTRITDSGRLFRPLRLDVL